MDEIKTEVSGGSWNSLIAYTKIARIFHRCNSKTTIV